MQQKSNREWNPYNVLELRGATLGIVGYGDIGRACAKLAHAYGMNIVGLRRRERPRSVENDDDGGGGQVDPYCRKVYYGNSRENLNQLFSESDYILVAAPLTPETTGMVGKEQFENAKKDAVLINLGRGPIVDEPSLIEALKNGQLK